MQPKLICRGTPPFLRRPQAETSRRGSVEVQISPSARSQKAVFLYKLICKKVLTRNTDAASGTKVPSQ